MRRVVITGGPSTGKTCLVNTLNTKGYSTFNEVAREIIKDQLSIKSDKVPWKDVTGFSKLVLNKQVNHFNKALNDLTFYDRGIPDIIGYMNNANKVLFDELITHSKNLRYTHVFILPPWEEIYTTDNERRESFEEAMKLYKLIYQAYFSLKYEPIVVPKVDIEERIKFILNTLNE